MTPREPLREKFQFINRPVRRHLPLIISAGLVGVLVYGSVENKEAAIKRQEKVCTKVDLAAREISAAIDQIKEKYGLTGTFKTTNGIYKFGEGEGDRHLVFAPDTCQGRLYDLDLPEPVLTPKN